MADAAVEPPTGPPTEPPVVLTDDAPDPAARPPRSGKVWRVTSVVLVVLTSVLAPIAVDSVWIREQILETDAFVEQMSPLLSDPGVQQQVIARIDEELTANVDLQPRIEETLPDQLQFLAGPAEEAIREFVHRVTERIVTSERFADIVERALRVTHATMMKVLTGGGPRVQVEEGVVTLDLTELRSQVVAKVESSGLGNFLDIDPDKEVRFTLMESTSLATAQRFVRLLDRLGLWLPVIVFALAFAAIFTFRSRRRGVLWVGTGLAIAMVVHLVGLAVGRSLYLDVVTKTLSKNASGVAYDLLVQFPRTGTRTVLLLALLLIAGAMVAGPSSWAVRLRALVAGAAGRGGTAAAASGPVAAVGRFVAPRETGLRAAVFVIAALTLLIGSRPSPASLIWTAVITLLAVIVLRILAAAGEAPPPDDAAPGDPPSADEPVSV